jgi:hypothetical protein
LHGSWRFARFLCQNSPFFVVLSFPIPLEIIAMKSVSLSLIAVLLVGGASLAQQSPVKVSQDLDPTLNLSNQTFPTPFQSSRAASECDDFNRADGAVGGDWTVQSNSYSIISNECYGAGGNGWMQHNSASAGYDGTSLQFDLTPNPGGLTYVAAVTGIGSNQLYTKVQSNGGTLYDYIGAYVGFNGGGFGSYGGFFAITPVTGGHVTVSHSTDNTRVEIDENYDGVTDYTYDFGALSSSGLAAQLGTGAGVGTWDAVFDNWDFNDGCGSITLATTGTPGGSMTFDVAGATASGPVALMYGFGTGAHTGLNPYTGNMVTTGLSSTSFTVAVVANADAAGNMSHTQFVPSAAIGLVAVQAIDLLSDNLSNVISL